MDKSLTVNGLKRTDLATVSIYPSFLCDMSCKMCAGNRYREINKAESNDYDISRELDNECWRTIIQDVATVTDVIRISGGEPLLFPGIHAILEEAAGRGLKVKLLTNGSMLSDFASELMAIGVEAISVSIDGPRAIHNRIRKGDYYAKIIEGIRRLLDLRKTENRSIPTININTTIMKDNIEYLSEMVALARDIGVDSINFNHLQFLDDSVVREHNKVFEALFGQNNCLSATQNFGLEGNDVAKVISQIGVQKTTRPWISTWPALSNDHVALFYNTLDLPKILDLRCEKPWHSLSIMPNGSVTTCLNYIVGRLPKEKFQQILFGVRLERFRNELTEHGRFPGCARCCQLFKDLKDYRTYGLRR